MGRKYLCQMQKILLIFLLNFIFLVYSNQSFINFFAHLLLSITSFIFISTWCTSFYIRYSKTKNSVMKTLTNISIILIKISFYDKKYNISNFELNVIHSAYQIFKCYLQFSDNEFSIVVMLSKIYEFVFMFLATCYNTTTLIVHSSFRS